MPTEAVCVFCGILGYIITRRLNTAYSVESSNWMCSCLDCYRETVDHYRELWDEYYSGQAI
jgi:hypothetical protein